VQDKVWEIIARERASSCNLTSPKDREDPVGRIMAMLHA
jgi:hypothetical protein